jgi:hypothetical protein
MATTAPPVPTSSQGGLLVDSAETGTSVVSGIASAPANSSADVVPHTGQANGYDPILNEQYICVSNLTWSTSQLPGTLLWSTRIHPDECNAFVGHISKMYNAWAGSLDFRVKVAGTGFHAGALYLVRLPPNIDPASLLTLQDITPFEYAMVDPKILDPVDRLVMDQRPILYHYRNPVDPADPNSFGGYFCIYVGIQLNTSSSGATNISLQVFSRAGPDLVFSQLRPLQQTGVTTFGKVSTLFPSVANHPLATAPVFLAVNPVSVVSPQWYYKSVNLNGEPNCDGQTVKNMKVTLNDLGLVTQNDGYIAWAGGILTPGTAAATYPQADVGWMFDTLDWKSDTETHHEMCYNLGSYETVVVNSPVAGTGYIKFRVVPEAGSTQLRTSKSGSMVQVTSLFTGKHVDDTVALRWKHDDATGQQQWAPPLTESIITFDAHLHGGGYAEPVVQSREMIDLLLTGHYSGVIDPSTAILVSVVDKETSLQVGYIKLYSNGIMTTRYSTTRVLFSWDKYQFIPIQTMGANVPIPVNASIFVNRRIAFEENGDLRINREEKRKAVPGPGSSQQDNRSENSERQTSRRDAGIFSVINGYPIQRNSCDPKDRSSSLSSIRRLEARHQ